MFTGLDRRLRGVSGSGLSRQENTAGLSGLDTEPVEMMRSIVYFFYAVDDLMEMAVGFVKKLLKHHLIVKLQAIRLD